MARKMGKTHKITEELSREFKKVNMEAAELMEMPNTDKKRKQGKGSARNQFK
ncbi:hypothetical protein CLHOM_13260 [Clostridium homopropionicum DSM 5847]|uniref:Uncharacterized protein n=1 Tax=Clostridium homopropionicum DSM 5847 TaxID=1121318 RepID=A0A0L6ZAY4_9CLOT|nr:hypothetical protein [Clostridium homopropionicum]KOA20131.1 hypothetical protein CLHOM_13260 [Clostridium homopropionicum DSM 5847]SFG61841.1 hypothetical protein SAMN04488501_111149 [Clostridium homopropionicum]